LKPKHKHLIFFHFHIKDLKEMKKKLKETKRDAKKLTRDQQTPREDTM
jgi:hypothetical protein